MTAHVGVLGPFLALPQGSSPRRRRGYLERVYEAFISTGSMDPRLRPMVAESWRLSLASGVSPDGVLPTVDLLDAAGILEGEAVEIWDVTNAARLTTYALAGERSSGVICVNGAAAHLVHAGNLVIIASFVSLDDAEARLWQPRAVFVDGANRVVERRAERLPARGGDRRGSAARAGRGARAAVLESGDG